VCDVYQHVQDGEGRHETTAHDHDPANVADDVGVFLGRFGRQQTLAARATGPRGLSGPNAIASARSTGFCGALLSDDLGLELGGSGFLSVRQSAGRTGRDAGLGSVGGVSVNTPLARTVRSTGALGHVR
jgi:hypothetical protein